MDHLLTEERIIFDAIGVDPVRASDGEQGGGRSIRRTRSTGAVRRREVCLQVERAESARQPIRVCRLNTPVLDGRIGEEQIPSEGEVSRSDSFKRISSI
jgi:hypothetical protein